MMETYIPALLILVGYLLIVLKRPVGFAIQIVGCIWYIGRYYGVDNGVALVNMAFVIINVMGLIKWRKT